MQYHTCNHHTDVHSYLPEAGEYQCLMLYLEYTIQFSKGELAAFIGVLGILSIVAQT